jgi:hypothetical protein
VEGEALTVLLQELFQAVRRTDPGCGRVVYAADDGDHDQGAAAESAGFRHVADVDLAAGILGVGTCGPRRMW